MAKPNGMCAEALEILRSLVETVTVKALAYECGMADSEVSVR